MTVCLILRDGERVGICNSDDQGVAGVAWFHQNSPGISAAHALEHEGYSIENVDEVDCHDVEELISAICKRAGIVMHAVFVPFSQSRNAHGDAPGFKSVDGKPRLCLNWKVSFRKVLSHGGAREFLTTDYSQGSGHAPAAKYPKGHFMHSGLRESVAREIAVQHECETGRQARFFSHSGTPVSGKPIPAPTIGEVMQALARDADVLDAGGFEAWASDLGYDPDSRTAESIYRACLEIALSLRANLGEHLLAEIRLAASF